MQEKHGVMNMEKVDRSVFFYKAKQKYKMSRKIHCIALEKLYQSKIIRKNFMRILANEV
jgi:hypothetical protein